MLLVMFDTPTHPTLETCDNTHTYLFDWFFYSKAVCARVCVHAHFHTDMAYMQTFDMSLGEENEVSDTVCLSGFPQGMGHYHACAPHTCMCQREIKCAQTHKHLSIGLFADSNCGQHTDEWPHTLIHVCTLRVSHLGNFRYGNIIGVIQRLWKALASNNMD